METQPSEISHLASKKKSAFLLIILPLIITILLVVIFSLTVFLNSAKNPFLLKSWANISIIIISLFFFLPGFLFLAIIISLNLLLGKTLPVVGQGLKKIQTIAANLSHTILAITKMVLFPFSIAKVLKQNGKVEYPMKEESVDE
jgi:hypothetical protein